MRGAAHLQPGEGRCPGPCAPGRAACPWAAPGAPQPRGLRDSEAGPGARPPIVRGRRPELGRACSAARGAASRPGPLGRRGSVRPCAPGLPAPRSLRVPRRPGRPRPPRRPRVPAPAGPRRTHLSAPCPASSPAGRAPHTARAAPRRRPSPSMSSLPGPAPARWAPRAGGGGGGREGPRRAASGRVRPSVRPRSRVGGARWAALAPRPPRPPRLPAPRAPHRCGPRRCLRLCEGTGRAGIEAAAAAAEARAPRPPRTPVSRSAAEPTRPAEPSRADPSPSGCRGGAREWLARRPISGGGQSAAPASAAPPPPPGRRERSGSWVPEARPGRGPGGSAASPRRGGVRPCPAPARLRPCSQSAPGRCGLRAAGRERAGRAGRGRAGLLGRVRADDPRPRLPARCLLPAAAGVGGTFSPPPRGRGAES